MAREAASRMGAEEKLLPTADGEELQEAGPPSSTGSGSWGLASEQSMNSGVRGQMGLPSLPSLLSNIVPLSPEVLARRAREVLSKGAGGGGDGM